MLTPITCTTTNRICALLLGESGTGKTSQIRCLLGQENRGGKWVNSNLQPEKVFVLSAEAGLLCVRDLVVAGKVQGFEIHNLSEFKEAFGYCNSVEFKQKGFSWIVIDSLTEIASRCVSEMQGKYPNKSDSYKLWQDYTNVLTDIVKAFRDISSVSVAVTCLLAYEKDEFQRRYPVPDIPGSGLKSRLVSYFDESLVLSRIKDAEGKEHLCFQTTEPAGLAKDRSGKLAPVEEPNILKIKNKIISK